MSYSYAISFNASDYTDFTPSNDITIEGSWIDDTYIFRKKLSEVKIDKALNSTVYATLLSWFDDSTKFETKIWIKRLNNGVQESLHWFGIKWGKLNDDLTFYTVKPTSYDLWGQYFEPYVGDKLSVNPPTSYLSIYDNTTTYHDLITTYNAFSLEDVVKTKISSITGFSSSNIVSSFMWADDFEDGTPTDTIYGLHRNYLNNEPSVLRHASAIFGAGQLYDITLMDAIKMFKMFQVYCYFDTNNKLRFEHIYYIKQQMIANAVSVTIPEYFDGFEYLQSEIPIIENIDLTVDADDDNADFVNSPIKYSPIRNRVDTISVQETFDFYTDAKYYNDNSLSGKILFAGYKNLAMNWLNSNMDSFSATYNHLTLSATSDGVNDKICYSYNFRSSGTTAWSFNVTSFGASQFELRLKKRSSGLVIHGPVYITGTGLFSGTFSSSTYDDTYVELRVVKTLSGSLTGDFIIEDNAGSVPLNNQWATGKISTTSVMNGNFSHANILYDYWRYDRLSHSGTMNGSVTAFNSTKYNLKRDSFKIHYPDVINPMALIDDGSRKGKILSYTRDDNDFVEFNLAYQEDV